MTAQLLAALFYIPLLFPSPAQSQAEQAKETWVRHYASGLAPTVDVAVDIAVDTMGNVYLTGYTTQYETGADFLTIKYDPRGNQLWSKRYNRANADDDKPVALAVAADGNIYVTGTSGSVESARDFTTIKYDSEGAQQWVKYYNGPSNNRDIAGALALDETGNVYITGGSVGGFYDFATIKYDPAGNEQWVARYEGAANSGAGALAIAVAHSGNVYVAGYCFESSIHLTLFVTVKYNAKGEQQWAVPYGGSGFSENYVRDLALDANENVYITGASRENGLNFDYTTLKYDSTGMLQWEAHYPSESVVWNFGYDLAVDAAENVFVAGPKATLKYDRAGVLQWQVATPSATALSLDRAGNIYVSDQDYRTTKINANGIKLWESSYQAAGDKSEGAVALVLDAADHVYVVGFSSGYGSDYDANFELVKYDASGAQRWNRQVDFIGNSKDESNDMAVDAAGNVYVTGWSLTATSSRDFLTIKYNALGEMQWLARYNGAGNTTDEANAIAVDADGNVYVTGTSYSRTESFCTTIGYNSVGVEQWVEHYRGPRNDFNGGEDLLLDAQGNVYVTGWSTLKYDQAGALQWALDYGDIIPPLLQINAKSIARDAAGNIYIAGGLYGAGRFAKLNSHGRLEWSNAAPLESNGGFAVDDSGNVYLAGWLESQHGVSSYETFKYNTNGVLQWNANYHQSAHSDDKPSALALDASGNVYVTGRSGPEGATIKYNSAGAQQWLVRYNNPSYYSIQPTRMLLDVEGNIFITGYGAPHSGLNRETDFITTKFNNAGDEQWSLASKGASGALVYPVAIAQDAAENVVVAGTTTVLGAYSGGAYSFFTAVKYDQTRVAVQGRQSEIADSYHLAQNYPNPFKATTLIRYTLPRAEEVTLKIFNLAGQEIATLFEGKRERGEYSGRWHPGNLPAGVYVYQLQCESVLIKKKLVYLH